MILKIRSVGGDITFPAPVVKDGLRSVTLEMVGELVLVPRNLVDRCERIVGEASLSSPLPLGIEVAVDPPNDELNGFWVQRPVFDAVKAENGASDDEEISAALDEEPIPEATDEDLKALAAAVQSDARGAA